MGEVVGFHQQVIEETKPAKGEFARSPYIVRMLTEGLGKAEYLTFLGQAYHVVWHFCPIMAAAASRLADHGPYRDLRYMLYDRCEDEKGHERIVLEDVAAAGGDVEAVRSAFANIPVQALVAFNYQMAERGAPGAVLGMLYVHETALSEMGPRATQTLSKSTGLNAERGIKFIASHAEADAEHAAGVAQALDMIVEPGHQKALLNAIKVNYHLLGRLM